MFAFIYYISDPDTYLIYVQRFQSKPHHVGITQAGPPHKRSIGWQGYSKKKFRHLCHLKVVNFCLGPCKSWRNIMQIANGCQALSIQCIQVLIESSWLTVCLGSLSLVQSHLLRRVCQLGPPQRRSSGSNLNRIGYWVLWLLVHGAGWKLSDVVYSQALLYVDHTPTCPGWNLILSLARNFLRTLVRRPRPVKDNKEDEKEWLGEIADI